MKRGHSTKKIRFGCSCFWTPIGPNGATQEHRHGIQQPHYQHRSHHRQQWHSQQPSCAAQEKCGAAQPQRFALSGADSAERQSNSTHHQAGRGLPHPAGRGGQERNTRRVSDRDGAVPQLQLWQHRCHCAAAAHGYARSGIRHMERDGPVREARREGHPDSRADDRLPAEECRGRTEHRCGRQHQAVSRC